MLQWMWPSDSATCPPTPEPTPQCQSASVSAHLLRASPYSLIATPVHMPAGNWAECSTRWLSAQHFRSIIQPNYHPPCIVSTRGRRRQVDTSTHFCPHPAGEKCAHLHKKRTSPGSLSPDGRGQGRLVHTTQPVRNRFIGITRTAQGHDQDTIQSITVLLDL
jgi:hypothetical protein